MKVISALAAVNILIFIVIGFLLAELYYISQAKDKAREVAQTSEMLEYRFEKIKRYKDATLYKDNVTGKCYLTMGPREVNVGPYAINTKCLEDLQ